MAAEIGRWLVMCAWLGATGLGGIGLAAAEAPRAAPAGPPPATLSHAALPAAELFFRNPDIQTARLSPGGRWMAATVGMGNGRFALAVFALERGTPPSVVAHFPDTDIRRFEWVNDERLVYDTVDLERGGGDPRFAPGLFSVRRDGSELRQLVEMRRDFVTAGRRPGERRLSLSHVLLKVPSGGGDEVVVGEWQVDGWGEPVTLVPKRLNVVTGHVRSLALGMPARVTEWLFDAQGRPRVATARLEGRQHVYWRAQPDAETAESWVEIGRFDALRAPWTPRQVDAEGRLYVTTPDGPSGEAVLRRFDFTTGRPEPEPLVSTPGFDFAGSVLLDAESGRFLGVRVDTDTEQTVWLDPRMKAVQEAVDRRLPGRVNRLACHRCGEAAGALLVASWSDREPGEFWLWRGDPDAPELWLRMGQRRKGVGAPQMAAVDFHRYAARDGRGIPLWVTTPAGPASGPRPAVVLVHGGPWVRGGQWAWEPMAQFLASRGYVVLAPEFRGSTGYGAAHFRAGWKQWGRAMQDDLADAVAWAAARQLVDPARVCIAGASYGGYATLMGLVRHPEVYRCGAAWVAVAEPALLFKSTWESDLVDEVRLYTLPVLLGDPVTDAASLSAVSPVAQVAQLKAPLLLAYGERDRRVPLEHGTRLREALQAAGREPEYVVYAGEGHAWRRTETRVDFAQRLERFLALHLRAPDGGPGPATRP
ncbi:MAG: S9 family peptidase [Leptothrix sp. (in: Bacteria)]|nr:S9 family peptidase [Leptothrix sp. (in: b-proteobacteria)]